MEEVSTHTLILDSNELEAVSRLLKGQIAFQGRVKYKGPDGKDLEGEELEAQKKYNDDYYKIIQSASDKIEAAKEEVK